jgi:hypothetical protein
MRVHHSPFDMTSLHRASIITVLRERDGSAASLSRKALSTRVGVRDLDGLAAFRAKVQGAASARVEVHSDALVVLDTGLAAGGCILVRKALALPQVLRIKTILVSDRPEAREKVGRGALG